MHVNLGTEHTLSCDIAKWNVDHSLYHHNLKRRRFKLKIIISLENYSGIWEIFILRHNHGDTNHPDAYYISVIGKNIKNANGCGNFRHGCGIGIAFAMPNQREKKACIG